ncbi:30S ribosome-binding factor RbfA [Dongia sp.]|uniref:30S ribosome-binding factor RbfA n=1 Tax=Dongia sp. TaxID=1977262 RepID=UPI0035B2EA42
MPRKKTITPKAGQRQLRIAEEIRHALSGIIADNSLSDPDLAGRMITVTVVKISPDLRNATIFIAPFGGGDAEAIVRALNRAAGYFRGEVAREVDMRVSPQLRFKIDDSFEEASRIEALLHDPVVRADLAKKPDSDSDK